MARAVLRWSAGRLGTEANLSGETIRIFESGVGKLHVNHLSAIETALRTAGVEFITHPGGEVCVHFPRKAAKSEDLVKHGGSC